MRCKHGNNIIDIEWLLISSAYVPAITVCKQQLFPTYVGRIVPSALTPEFTIESGPGVGEISITITNADEYSNSVSYRVVWGDTEENLDNYEVLNAVDNVITLELEESKGYWFNVRVQTDNGSFPSAYSTPLPCVAGFNTPEFDETDFQMSDEGSPAIFYVRGEPTTYNDDEDYYTYGFTSTETGDEFFDEGTYSPGVTYHEFGPFNVGEEFLYQTKATYIRSFAGIEFSALNFALSSQIGMP